MPPCVNPAIAAGLRAICRHRGRVADAQRCGVTRASVPRPHCGGQVTTRCGSVEGVAPPSPREPRLALGPHPHGIFGGCHFPLSLDEIRLATEFFTTANLPFRWLTWPGIASPVSCVSSGAGTYSAGRGWDCERSGIFCRLKLAVSGSESGDGRSGCAGIAGCRDVGSADV
jgi:hypothetical protein